MKCWWKAKWKPLLNANAMGDALTWRSIECHTCRDRCCCRLRGVWPSVWVPGWAAWVRVDPFLTAGAASQPWSRCRRDPLDTPWTAGPRECRMEVPPGLVPARPPARLYRSWRQQEFLGYWTRCVVHLIKLYLISFVFRLFVSVWWLEGGARKAEKLSKWSSVI